MSDPPRAQDDNDPVLGAPGEACTRQPSDNESSSGTSSSETSSSDAETITGDEQTDMGDEGQSSTETARPPVETGDEEGILKPNVKRETYDKSKWRVVQQSSGYDIVYLPLDKKYSLPANRVDKALLLLDPEDIVTRVLSRPCRCRRRCPSQFSVKTILDLRYSVLKLSSEQVVVENLGQVLRSFRSSTGVLIYRVSNTIVCSTFWAACHGSQG